MEKIFITTQTGQKVEVGVVRLFKHNETVFFIYTLSEKDASNYVKLYVTKVNMNNLQSVVITDENEWASFKDIMKTIIKNNRNNAPLEVVDLDAKVIENITVYDPKVFKLSEEMANFLQMNINLATNVGEVAPTVPQSTVPDVFSTHTGDQGTDASKPIANPEPLSGDISANPEPASVVEQNINQDMQLSNIPDVQSADTNISDATTDLNISMPDIAGDSVAEPAVDNTIKSIAETSPNMEISAISDSESITADVIDYKVAYLEEQLKVESLNTKIATLEAQIKLLEQKIEQVKKVIE